VGVVWGTGVWRTSPDLLTSRRAAFLFGAGASAAADPYETCPPLSKDLYAHLLKAGHIPSEIPAQVRLIFESDPNFEHGLEAMAGADTASLCTSFLRNMAVYFSGFSPGPTKIYREFLRRLRQTGGEFALASLNYDLMLEQCKLEAGFTKPVCKPNGDCGCLPQSVMTQPASKVVRGTACNSSFAPAVTFDIMRATNAKEITEWLRANPRVTPVMGFYAQSEWSSGGPSFIAQQRKSWEAIVNWADTCFVVGVACIPDDTHIWQPLAHSRCILNFINPSDAGFSDWCARTSRKHAHHVPLKFHEALDHIFA
jgi:hypothetical protein